jgi:AP2 domain
VRTIPLTQGLVALVDEQDHGALTVFKWFARRGGSTFYAVRNGPRPSQPSIYMHRVLLSLVDGASNVLVDHRNGNGLDNRRSNIRVASNMQNLANQHSRAATSRFKGVSWDSERGAWQANITFAYRKKYLGRFVSEVSAARAYDSAALSLFGPFARLNAVEFPSTVAHVRATEPSFQMVGRGAAAA